MLDVTDAIEDRIRFEGPDTVAAVFLEPVQNGGGCFVPPEGYFQRVREICDRYGVLLVSDEVICAFGRLGDDVRLRALRLPPRHDHVRQGPHERLLAVRRGDLSRLPRRAVPRAARRVVRARHHVRRSSGELCGRAREPRRRSTTNACSTTCARTSAELRARLDGLRDTTDRRRRARRRLLLGHRARARPGDQGDVPQGGAGSAPARVHRARASTTPASSAAPTTAATRSCSSRRP